MQDPCWTRCASASLAGWASPSGSSRGRLLAGEAPAPTAPQPANRPPTRCWPRRRPPSADRQALAAGRDAARALPARGHLPLARPWHGRGLPAVRMPSLPAGPLRPLLWLTAPDPRWPDALVCPLKPDGAHKRALWQQCRQRARLDAHDHGTAHGVHPSLNPVRVTMSDLLPHFRPPARIGLRSHLPHRAGRPPRSPGPGQPALLLRAALSPTA